MKILHNDKKTITSTLVAYLESLCCFGNTFRGLPVANHSHLALYRRDVENDCRLFKMDAGLRCFLGWFEGVGPNECNACMVSLFGNRDPVLHRSQRIVVPAIASRQLPSEE